MRFTALLLTFFFFQSVQAEVYTEQVQAGEVLIVKGEQGDIQLSTSGSELSVNAVTKSSLFGGGIKIYRENGAVVVKLPKELKSKVSLTAPPMPLKLYWKNGNLSLKSWKADINIVSSEGKITVEQSEGVCKLNLQKGSVAVSSHKGHVEVDTYTANVDLKSVKGRIHLEDFRSKTQLTNLEGDIEFISFKGSLSGNSTTGAIDFTTEQSQLDLKGHKGRLAGKINQGQLSAQLLGSPRVNVKSKEATVALKASGAAKVDLGTSSGYLSIPAGVYRSRLPNMVVARGRTAGSNPGHIYVRTESGSIRLQ